MAILICPKFGYEYLELSTTPRQVRDSIEFAQLYVADMKFHYSNARNQTNESRILEQKITGTCFEYAVYNYAKEFGEVSEPDITIWDKSKKSYAKDMTFKKEDGTSLHLHVKSQELSTINNYDYISFAFQHQDSLITKPRGTDFILAGLVEDNLRHRLIIDISAEDVVGLYGEPKLAKLKGDKKFLYLKDIITAGLKVL